MKHNTEKLYEMANNANNSLVKNHQDLHTSLGLMDQALRAKGIGADAVTIDNVSSKIRVIFIIMDNNPDTVGIGVGSTLKDDISFLSEHPIAKVNVALISDILEQKLL